jgi:hypothetical protein
MIKKIVSKALLTVFMDKKARKILHAVRTARETPTTASKVNTLVSVSQPEYEPHSLNHAEITSSIKESLDTAEEQVADTKKSASNKTKKPAVNQSRQNLIENALSIHKSKSHIIDQLPAEQRKKLKLLAFQLFSEQLKDG